MKNYKILLLLLFSFPIYSQSWDETGNNNTTGTLWIGSDNTTVEKLRVTANGSNRSYGMFGATGTGNAAIILDASNGDFIGSDYAGLVHQDSDLSLELTNFGSNPIHFKTANTNRMTILGNGNIGIGVPSPIYALDVSRANHNVARFRSTGTNSGADVLIVDQDNSNTRAALQVQGNSGAVESLFVSSGGSVGIGTTFPKEVFQIGDRWTFHSGGHKIIGYNYNYDSGDKRIVNDEVAAIRLTDAGDMRLLTSGADVAGSSIVWSNTLILKNDGRVGIGVLYPDTKLETNGAIRITSTTPVIHFKENDITDNNFQLDVSGGNFNIRTNNNVFTSASTKFSILNNGDVGIGTTNTFGYKLAVNGTIGSKEVNVEVSSAWPDFVFNANYILPTLTEVETHIKENGHLKDIPSEAEVKENGINLGEMDAKLLQKIEELTLYTIEQEKKIQKLEKENEALKSLSERVLKIEEQIKQKK